jgi:hypothetical protein
LPTEQCPCCSAGTDENINQQSSRRINVSTVKPITNESFDERKSCMFSITQGSDTIYSKTFNATDPWTGWNSFNIWLEDGKYDFSMILAYTNDITYKLSKKGAEANNTEKINFDAVNDVSLVKPIYDGDKTYQEYTYDVVDFGLGFKEKTYNNYSKLYITRNSIISILINFYDNNSINIYKHAIPLKGEVTEIHFGNRPYN